ncbi:hypothetical protein [Undibacterium sp.]|uniref:hypothetical protein n=1 Tax=Undibacterium sp. TaxID=1914977 RepID=UPI00374FEDB4
MKPTDFWHDNIGKYLCDLPSNQSTSALIPHRTQKGIQALRIGAIDAFYIATPAHSYVIGRIEIPGNQKISFVPIEEYSARKYLAAWLINDAVSPFIVGVISLANAASSMRISHHVTKSYFCEANAGFEFNLEKVRKALPLIQEFSWKKDIAPAIHLHSNWMHAEGDERQQLNIKLMALLKKNPSLRSILSTIDIRPNSGEYQILSWYNIDTK